MISQRFKKTKLPDSPGVYFFLNRQKKPLYIGKATSIRSRVKSYFTSDIGEKRSPLIAKLIDEVHSIDFKKTESVLEALILETDLIKKFKPPYNTKEKDDRSFNYVVMTKEDFPRILIARKKDLDSKLKAESYKLKATFGPFTNGAELRVALKIIRKIFPFRDTCEPSQKRPCFNYQIGLCPGVCVDVVSKSEYSENARHIKMIFQGKTSALLKELERSMKFSAKDQKFELANKYKKEVFALKHINDVALLGGKGLTLGWEKGPTLRIEAYDVAHLAGADQVGVMAVWQNGEVDKSAYRVFNLRETKAGDDLAGLNEILRRRLGHREWPLPKIIVVDGGEAQKRLAEKIIKDSKLAIPTLAVIKDSSHKPKSILGNRELINKYKKSILLLNNEAHRFAISRYRLKSQKKMFE